MEVNTSQRRRIISVLRYYRKHNSYTKCTSVRLEVNTEYEHFVSLVVTTRRSDCDRYSPRQVICAQRMHATIGKRGGMKVHSASDGTRNCLAHVRTMLNAN